jgi:hypothetical protein
MEVNIGGATEETRAFQTVIRSLPGASPPWHVLGTLVAVYQVTAPSGTVTIEATLLPNTQPRRTSGPDQWIGLNTVFSHNVIDLAEGPPEEALTVRHSYTYDETSVARQVFLLGAGGLPGQCGPSGACSSVWTYLVILGSREPYYAFAGLLDPPVLPRSVVTFFQGALPGVNPLTDVTQVAIDGEAMMRVPSGVIPLNQSPGAGKWDRVPRDPLPPHEVEYPYDTPVGIESFLGCGGGGCGSPGVRVGLPANITTGLHTVSVHGGAYEASTYKFFSEPALLALSGRTDLAIEQDFILIDPQLRVSPLQAEAGSTVTVSGTGFMLNNDIPLRVSVHCCGPRVPLGTARSDHTGAFSLRVALPPVNAPPFSSTFSSSDPPGTSEPGAVWADVGDALFVAKYGPSGGPHSASITFVKPGGTPTTTTLPARPCSGDPECDDGDPCTQDTCTAGTCVSTRLTGAASIQCGLAPEGLRPPVCTNERVPPRAEKQYRKATGLIDRATVRGRRAVRRLIKKADKALKRVERAVDAAWLAGELSDGCAEGIGEVIGGLRDRIKLVLDDR